MVNDFIFHSLGLAGFIYLIRYTDGPGDVFRNFRIWLGIMPLIEDDGSEKEFIDDKFFAKLFACHWCLSFWLVIFTMPFVYGCCNGTLGVVNGFMLWFATIFVTCLLLEIVLKIGE